MDATTVGKYFYSKNQNLTDIQIQKLTYYAYAWYQIKHNGNKLFDEKPQAWIHGPVFRSLYDAMKRNDFYKEELTIDLGDIKDFLDLIYNVYGKYSGNELEAMTHSEIPWIRARHRAGLTNLPGSRATEEIQDEDIIEWGSINN